MRFFALLAILFSLATPALADDCSLKQVVSLDMLPGYPGRVIVQLSIAGKPRLFLVDTGGFMTSVFDDVAKELDLKTQPIGQDADIYDVEGTRMGRYTKIPDLMIGPMKGDYITVIVMPRHGNDDLPGVDGILGPDVLSQFDAEFDFANRKLNLMLPNHCPGKVVYWSSNYADVDFHLSGMHIVLDMTLDGHNVSAVFDTGSPTTHIYDNAARNVFGLTTASPGMEPIPGIEPGSLEQFRYRFKSLSVGDLAIANPLVYILPNLAQQSFAHNHTTKEDFDPVYAPHLESTNVILGMDVISKLHLYIAYKEHKIYLTSAAAH